jgi:hypothetical protein
VIPGVRALELDLVGHPAVPVFARGLVVAQAGEGGSGSRFWPGNFALLNAVTDGPLTYAAALAPPLSGRGCVSR